MPLSAYIYRKSDKVCIAEVMANNKDGILEYAFETWNFSNDDLQIAWNHQGLIPGENGFVPCIGLAGWGKEDVQPYSESEKKMWEERKNVVDRRLRKV